MFRYFLAGVGIFGVLALAGFLLTRYGAARYEAGELAERGKWKDAAIKHEQLVAGLERRWGERVSEAQSLHVQRIETIRPVVVTNKETVVRYAQTPAGRSQCLAPERVLGIEQTRTGLFTPAAQPTGNGAATLPPDGALQER